MVQEELDKIYEELDKKKGAPQAKSQQNKKSKSRDDRRRQFAEKLKESTSKPKKAKQNQGIAEDRMELYSTKSKKKTKKTK